MQDEALLNSLLEHEVETDFAVGNDLVHIQTFLNSLTPPFIRKVYTEQEVAYCEAFNDPTLRYASTWSAKEAVYKAIKQLYPDELLAWKKIEIIRKKPSGKPHVFLHESNVNQNLSLSISHDGSYVWAIALLRMNQPPEV
ncbi:MAG: holo-ACP synthase [Cyclobacteriaceae bacterium]